MKTFSLINETNATLPNVAFRDIKEEVLGKDYILSVIIASPEKMQQLNTAYRQKNSPTDILSFPIDDNEGEIYLCLPEAEKECIKFDRSFENFVPFLFIHGCVHLKGFDHGAKMESEEEKIRQKFGI